MVDSRGTEIGFYAGGTFLNTGKETISFIFDGNNIGLNGIDGPYFLKGLLIFGTGGSNLVVTDVAETSTYAASEFEGFVGNEPPIAQCQGVTVSADTQCLGSASVDNGSYDPDGDSLIFTLSPEGPYPLGNNEVTLTVTDTTGDYDQCIAYILVVDDSVPTVLTQSISVYLDTNLYF